jgi:hypothetical protein
MSRPPPLRSARLATSKGQDLVGAHARIGASAERLKGQPSPGRVFAGLSPGLANTGVVSGQFKLDFGVRQEPQTVPDLLRDGDLSLAGDLYGNTWRSVAMDAALALAGAWRGTIAFLRARGYYELNCLWRWHGDVEASDAPSC